MSSRQAPDRNIAMELVRVTEAGALAAARWIGRGDKESADQAAVDERLAESAILAHPRLAGERGIVNDMHTLSST